MQQLHHRRLVIFILGLLSTIGPFSIDMYLPGFPSIAAALHTSAAKVAYSLSSFFIGICVGQLVSGPLLDRYGRKRPLIISLVIYIVASIGCSLSTSVEMLILMRFLQAVGCCVTMVAPRAIIRDLFPLNENAKIMSLMILILGVSPLLAPTFGSFVIASFGWNYIFVILAIISAIILAAMIIYLPESHQPDPTFSLKLKPILSSFIFVSKNAQFFTYSMMAAVSFAGLFAYLAGSPTVFIEIYGLSQKQYGMVFAICAAGLITSSQLNNIAMRKFSSESIIKTMLAVQVLAGICLFAGTAFNILGLYGTIFCLFIYLSSVGFIFPNSAALSMAPFTREAGSASAVMGAVQMGIGSFSSAFVGIISDKTALPMTIVMASCALLAFFILILGQRKITVCSIDDTDQVIDMIEKV